MSVCSYKKHSYIIVGARDRETGNQYVLAQFGRFVQGLMPEGMPTRKEGILIGIQAFTISIEQYQQLFFYLKSSNPSIMCAIPKAWLAHENDYDPEGKIDFIWNDSLKKPAFKQTAAKKAELPEVVGGLSLSNNCRTNAKQITKKLLNTESLPGVSSLYFRSLPFKAHLSKGIIREELFIYPPPPPLKNMGDNERQWRILRKMYNRLNGIAKTALRMDNNHSHTKFNSLKTLYQQEYDKLMGANPLSIFDLLKDIQTWVDTDANKAVIDGRRSNSMFKFKTTTRKMFNDILKENKSGKPILK
ncbi:hypothetical protein Lrub_1492 [Legionella rubrilucens]|uniref:Uncharacterized protein n=2 Tax=Legionella rubrilucens TaxID=458 RepID=A0A0W0XTU6_9GAMM|nr:hypothetical protein Lrub_1492 [Legionella rubrilucens]